MKSPLPLWERVRVRGYVNLFPAFVLVNLRKMRYV